MKTGLVRMTGPMTKEEKVVWDRVRARKTECDQIIAELNDLLAGETDQAIRKSILDDIERERQLRTMISRAIPD
jgi:hypothetical protein